MNAGCRFFNCTDELELSMNEFRDDRNSCPLDLRHYAGIKLPFADKRAGPCNGNEGRLQSNAC
jgi:hypothetical protein